MGDTGSTADLRRRRERPVHRRLGGTVLAALGVAASIIGCGGGGDDSRFPEAAPGKLIEFFDPAEADIGFVPEMHYVSATALDRDGTLYLAVAEKRRVEDGDEYQDVDAGRLIAIPRSGEPEVVSTGMTTALTVNSKGKVYTAGYGSNRASLGFIRDGKERHILDYSARFGGPTPTSPGVDREVRGIAFDDGSGDIYLADAYKIDRVDRYGRLSTVAGSRREVKDPEPAGTDARTLAERQFRAIAGIAFDPGTGRLYVADGHLGAATPLEPQNVYFTAAVYDDAGNVESGLGRRGVAFDSVTGTHYSISKEDDTIVVQREDESPELESPYAVLMSRDGDQISVAPYGRTSKIKASKEVLENVVRMTMGGDGNVYLSGARKVYVLGTAK